MSLFETNGLEAPDELVEIIRNKRSIKELSQAEFDFLLLRPLWGSFITRSLETGRIPGIKGGLFQGDLYLGQELQNDLIKVYQNLLQAKAKGSNADILITENIIVPKEKIETYFNEVYNLLVSNNLYSLRSKVRQNKGNNEDADFDSTGLSMAIIGFTKELGEFDTKKDHEGILYHSAGTVTKFVRGAHKESKDDNYSSELTKVRKMIDDFLKIEPYENEIEPSSEEEGEEGNEVGNNRGSNDEYIGLTTRQILEVILGELPKTEAKFLLKHWESYLYVLGIGKVGYEEITGQEKWEVPKDIEVFRKGLIATLDRIDNKQRIKYVSEVAFRADQMRRSAISLDAPVGNGGDEECALSDMIEAPSGNIDVSDRIFVDWFLSTLRREVYQEDKHKVDLSLRDRIILGMMYEGFFKIGELYYLLEEYFGGYPVNYINHWDQFGFHGKPKPGNRNHPHSLDEYWLQFFGEEVDAMKTSSIAKILGLTEEGVVKIDRNIKDELNKHYRKTDKDNEVLFEFRYHEYKGIYSESHIMKENYVRTKYPRPKDY